MFAGISLSTLAYIGLNNESIYLSNKIPEKFYLGDQEFMENESLFSKSFYFQSGGAMIPHDTKLEKGGEDAYFATRMAAGIADGVGGWASKGIDPGIYSSFLMDYCRQYVEQGNKDPLDILTYGWSKCKGIVGSSTAVIVVLNGDEIDCLNLGDSGVLILNPKEKKNQDENKSTTIKIQCTLSNWFK